MRKHCIVLLPGDGIGPEISSVTKEVLKANLEKFIRVGGAETQMEKCRNVYDEIAGTLDCKSGQRASQAIIGLLNQH